MTAVCNLNGTIVSEQDATVPVLDRGFLFGDSVYEVMRTRQSIPFAWPEHLARLRNSAAGIGLDIDLDDDSILRRVKATIQAAEVPEAYIRIVVTRGTGTAPNIDLAFAPGPANYVILVRELKTVNGTAQLALIPRLRTDRASLDPGIKSGNYLNNLLGLAEAKARGATDCLFLNREGQVTEASTSNFFLVRGGRVHTPPVHAGLLRGITRTLLFDVCRELELEVDERVLTVEDVTAASEMFLTSTLRDIVPVVTIDERPVGDGSPGVLTRRLMSAFQEHCARRTKEDYAPGFRRV